MIRYNIPSIQQESEEEEEEEEEERSNRYLNHHHYQNKQQQLLRLPGRHNDVVIIIFNIVLFLFLLLVITTRSIQQATSFVNIIQYHHHHHHYRTNRNQHSIIAGRYNSMQLKWKYQYNNWNNNRYQYHHFYLLLQQLSTTTSSSNPRNRQYNVLLPSSSSSSSSSSLSFTCNKRTILSRTTSSTFATRKMTVVEAAATGAESADSSNSRGAYEFSLESLQQRATQYIQQQQQQPTQVQVQQQVESSNNAVQCCIVVAGGGGHVLSTISSTAGASSVLLDGTIPYSRTAFDQYIRSTNMNTDENQNQTQTETAATMKYCSEEAAQLLAKAAYERALNLVTLPEQNDDSNNKMNWLDRLRQYNNTFRNTVSLAIPSVMGVACTSVLQSSIPVVVLDTKDPTKVISVQQKTRKSVASKGSRAYITIGTNHGIEIQLFVQLYNNISSPTSPLSYPPRTRLDEDIVVSHYILSCMELYMIRYQQLLHRKLPALGSCDTVLNYNTINQLFNLIISEQIEPSAYGTNQQQKLLLTSDIEPTMVTRHGTTHYGDEITIQFPSNYLTDGADAENEYNNRKSGIVDVVEDTVDAELRDAAQRILSGQDEVVTILLLPPKTNITSNTNATINSDIKMIEVMTTTKLPPYSLVVPGSFNPIHVGHVALAQAAADAMSSSLSTTSTRTGSNSNIESSCCNAIFFELSITNVDKPALAIETIIERIKYFFPLRDGMYFNSSSSSTGKPIQCWGILLTNAPLFKQKVDLLSPLQLSDDTDSDDIRNSIGSNLIADSSILHFSIGTDTLVRLIDPKYYNNSVDDMYNALNDMNCHYIVGGRLDQKRPLNDTTFISGHEVVETIPKSIRNKFTILPNFRIDLSSTEIRQQMELNKQQQLQQRSESRKE